MRQYRFSLSMIREGGTQELVNQVDELFSRAPGTVHPWRAVWDDERKIEPCARLRECVHAGPCGYTMGTARNLEPTVRVPRRVRPTDG